MANSFHAATKVKITHVTSPGRASGRFTLRIVVSLLAPSIHAASSISAGMAARNRYRIQTANVRLNALLTRISPE
jgi:hypothetical protein